jgi:hypothetical protein
MLIEIRDQRFDVAAYSPLKTRIIRFDQFMIVAHASGFITIVNVGAKPVSIRWIQNVKPYMFFEPTIEPHGSFKYCPL